MKKSKQVYQKRYSIKDQPIASIILIAVNVFVFIYLFTRANGNANKYYEYLYNHWAVVSPKIREGQLYRLITAIFIHFDVKHLSNNMAALYVSGMFLEKKESKHKLIFIFLLSGIFGNVTSFAFNNQFSGGASGAIFGLIAALSAEILQSVFENGNQNLKESLKYVGIALLLPVIYIIPGIFIVRVNNIAHISGAVVGIVGSFVFDKDNYKYKAQLKFLGSGTIILSFVIMLGKGLLLS